VTDAARPDVPDDDLGRRRERTYGYLKLWGIETDLTVLPIVRIPTIERTSAEVCGRASATALVALKGQGLEQLETFAFADSYEVWDALTLLENDFVLDREPPAETLLQYAWCFEQCFAFEWALGLIPHLRFPDAPVDTGRVMSQLMERVLTVTPDQRPVVRTPKELADAADIAFSLQAIAAASPPDAMPMGLLRSIAEERATAFRWLLSY
jgi:Domain of unknown function (DUF4272)